jgi:hypothetical protein
VNHQAWLLVSLLPHATPSLAHTTGPKLLYALAPATDSNHEVSRCYGYPSPRATGTRGFCSPRGKRGRFCSTRQTPNPRHLRGKTDGTETLE